jgi:hypothetical protein
MTSSRILCPKCAAERRAALKAAKAAGAPAPAAARPVTAATTAAAAATAPPRRAARAEAADDDDRPRKRHTANDGHERIDVRKLQEKENKKIAMIGWMAVGGLVLITGIVLLVVMSNHSARDEAVERRKKEILEFRNQVMNVPMNDEQALVKMRDHIDANKKLYRGTPIETEITQQRTAIVGTIGMMVKTRGLVERMQGIEAQLAANPSSENLGKQYAAVRDADLKLQADDAGGQYQANYNNLVKKVARQYIDVLSAESAAAASATTGEALAPYGTLEDTLRLEMERAMQSTDTEAQQQYGSLLKKTMTEVDAIGARLFDEAYINKAPWIDLLADKEHWLVRESPTFKAQFGAGLLLTNAAGEEAKSGGVSYKPGENWRDYVLDMEFKLDSGTIVVYVRVGDAMDTKMVPGFTVGVPQGNKTFNVLAEPGKVHTLQVSVIGRTLIALLDGQNPYQDDIAANKSRRGEPGIVAQAGTNATISRMRVRKLR